MQAKEYCYNKVVIPGSTFAYSLKSLSASQRDALVAIQAFYQEIEDVVFHFTDLGVALARLNWWREEFAKISVGTPTHPVALFLQQQKITSQRLLNIIDGLEQNLSYLTFASYDEVIVHFMRTAGERELLFAETLNAKLTTEQVYQIMLAIELTNYLQYFRRYAERDLIYFSVDELKKFHVERSDFQLYKTTPAIRGLLSSQADKIKRAYEAVSKNLPRYFLVRLRIANAVLDVIGESDFAVLENFVDVTPLKRWWIALRINPNRDR